MAGIASYERGRQRTFVLLIYTQVFKEECQEIFLLIFYEKKTPIRPLKKLQHSEVEM
jgi:hypothetical protein